MFSYCNQALSHFIPLLVLCAHSFARLWICLQPGSDIALEENNTGSPAGKPFHTSTTLNAGVSFGGTAGRALCFTFFFTSVLAHSSIVRLDLSSEPSHNESG